MPKSMANALQVHKLRRRKKKNKFFTNLISEILQHGTTKKNNNHRLNRPYLKTSNDIINHQQTVKRVLHQQQKSVSFVLCKPLRSNIIASLISTIVMLSIFYNI